MIFVAYLTQFVAAAVTLTIIKYSNGSWYLLVKDLLQSRLTMFWSKPGKHGRRIHRHNTKELIKNMDHPFTVLCVLKKKFRLNSKNKIERAFGGISTNLAHN
jgi:hypothetical protein